MKQICTLALVVLLLFLGGCAGSSRYMHPAPMNVQPSVDKATVYFLRPSGFGFAINFQIWDGDKFIGLSQAKSYFAYQCEPGKHLFMAFSENKVAVEADLAAGKSYYIGTNVRTGMWKARVGFTPVTRGSALWDTVEAYKQSLHFLALNEADAASWEASKRAKAREFVDYFTTGAGRPSLLYLRKEDGR